MKKKLMFVLVLVVIVVISVVFFLDRQAGEGPNGLTKVESFHYIAPGEAACQAIIPECGVCYGQIINKSCYVDKSKLSHSELEIMGF